MNVVFITSGFSGIYRYFERSITQSFAKAGVVCKTWTLKEGVPALKTICQTFQPDLILTLTGFKLTAPILKYMNQVEAKTAIWLTEDPYYMDRTSLLIAYFDYVFTIDLAALDFYKERGHAHVYHLPLGTDTELYCPKEAADLYYSDLCLVGVPYTNRAKLIEYLLVNTNYKIQVVGRGWNKYARLWKAFPNLKVTSAWVKPETAVNYYNGAKIVLNSHRPHDEKYNRNRIGLSGKSVNNRTFDVASCQSFQLIEHKTDIDKHFNRERELVSYSNPEDLLAKIDYFLRNEARRKQIAAAARARVLTSHTFHHRMNRLLDIVCAAI